MNDQLEIVIMEAGDAMKNTIKHFEYQLSKIRAGKAHPQMVDGIMVEYYGSPTPINQVANISVSDARTLTIQPWEKPMIQQIERALLMANIGITPQNDGEVIRLYLPPLTEERRKDLVKNVNTEGENGKIAIRNNRRDAMESIKKLQKDGVSEDEAKGAEAQVQTLTDKNILSIEELCKVKEKEIMTI